MINKKHILEYISFEYNYLSVKTEEHSNIEIQNLSFFSLNDNRPDVIQKNLEFLNFYNFINDDALLKIFLDVINCINDSMILKNYNTYKNFLIIFDNSYIYCNICISLIIIKVLIKNSIYKKNNETLNLEIENKIVEKETSIIVNECYTQYNNFFLYNEKYTFKKINEEKKKYLDSNYFLLVLRYLVDKNLVKMNQKKNFKKNNIKTYNFYYLNYLINQNTICIDFGFSFSKFNFFLSKNEYYLISYMINSIKKICKENTNNNKKLNFLSSKYIENSLNTEYYINLEFIDVIHKELEKEHNKVLNLQIVLETLNKLNVEIKEVLNEFNVEFNKKKQKINKNYENIIKNLIDTTNDTLKQYNKEKFKKILNEKKNNLKYLQYTNLCKKYSSFLILANFFILKKIYIKEVPLYFSFFFDFRTRKYFHSYISPTNSSYLRTIYYYGKYTKEEMLLKEENEVSDIIRLYDKEIETIKNKFAIINTNIKINEGVFWLLISIGKHFINKNNIKIHIKEFINTAKKILEDSSLIENLKFSDKIECLHSIYVLKKLNDEEIKKYVILKDATSSVLQHYIRFLTPIDENALFLVNMNSKEYWIDTYSMFIEIFKIKNKNKSYYENVEKYLKRSNLKKSIMTHAYGVSYLESYKYFCSTLDILPNKDIKEMFKDFYNFLNKDLEKILFKNNSKTFLNDILKNIKEIDNIKTNDVEISLLYYNTITKTIDFKKKNEINEKIRFSINKKELTKEINLNKTKTSLRPNIIHASDAFYIRNLSLKLKFCYLTIHDCFLIDIFCVSKFIVEANKEMLSEITLNDPWINNLKKTNYKVFSVFLLL